MQLEKGTELYHGLSLWWEPQGYVLHLRLNLIYGTWSLRYNT